MQRSPHTLWSSLWVGSVLVGLVWYSTRPAQATEGPEVAEAAARQQLAATVMALEVTRHHVQQWESNPAARTLVARMLDDIVSSAERNTRWQSRFFTTAEDDPRQQPDGFERAAIQELAADGVKTKLLWSRDGKRVVSGVLAHQSCINCHDVAVGDVMAYVSLRLEAVQGKTVE